MIFHIVKRSEWEAAARIGSYRPASVDAEGFIHCSTLAQLIGTANRFYRGEKDLVVLCIDENRLAMPLKFEGPSMPDHDKLDRENADELFPHIYGALNLEAVTRVIELRCAADGRFAMPDELREA
ncbi:MAG: DUF952 domain-containing protein [Candidatus Binatus sp.]|uniref:DUF952 domain-containing protein n=1 Tax=Candidatus Binatus sp. TaxID=2811406 RepID=UPI0027251B15|nr:DUF952 domain-containing protein [Candidatus Binatus sp.]MDO8432219.1 DUF952 domain-containing protein [Candidatus Binatus sp.]